MSNVVNVLKAEIATPLPAPTVESLFRNTVPPTQLANGAGFAIRLLQNADDPLLTEPHTFHQNHPLQFRGILTYPVVQFLVSMALNEKDD
jgi:hypothetical protein